MEERERERPLQLVINISWTEKISNLKHQFVRSCRKQTGLICLKTWRKTVFHRYSWNKMRRTWPAEQGKQNKVLTEPHGVLLCCAHICQSPSADSCDTSHLVFETRLQLSLTGTPASISVSRRSSGGSRRAGSSDLTAVFCLLPEGLRAQWDKGTNIMFCVGAAPVCRKRSILPHLFLMCCFCVDLNQADGISSTFTLWLDCLLVDVVWSKSWLNLSRNYNLYSLVFYEFMFFCEIANI